MANTHPAHHRHLLLVLVLCLAAVTGCSQPPVDQRELTSFLPGEPSWLLEADFPALRAWEHWPLLEQTSIDREGTLRHLFTDAGIDPDKDLDRLVAGIYTEGAELGHFNAILTGLFNLEALQANLEGKGHRAELWREETFIVPGSAGHSDPLGIDLQDLHIVLFDETGIGLAETREGARAMIDRLLDGGKSLHQHPRFGPLLLELDQTAPFRGAGLIAEGTMDGLDADLPIKGMIPALSNFAFTMRLESGLQLTGITLLPNEEAAVRLAGQLDGWVKLAAGLLQINPQWLEKAEEAGSNTPALVVDTLNRVTVTSTGTVVRLEGGIPDELVRLAARSTSPGSPDPLPPGSTPAHP